MRIAQEQIIVNFDYCFFTFTFVCITSFKVFSAVVRHPSRRSKMEKCIFLTTPALCLLKLMVTASSGKSRQMVQWRKRTSIEIVLGVLLAQRLLGQIKEKTSPTTINILRVCVAVCLSVGLLSCLSLCLSVCCPVYLSVCRSVFPPLGDGLSESCSLSFFSMNITSVYWWL